VSCDCYDEGYRDGHDAAHLEAEERSRSRIETPIATAARGHNIHDRTGSRQVRDWAEKQTDDRFRWWLLGLADAMEQVEDAEAQDKRKAQARRNALNYTPPHMMEVTDAPR
jgi:hypothetical protein